jgi:hypothetical protein
LNREGIIAVCVGAFLAVPMAIWLHIRLSRRGERNRFFGWLAMASFLIAWLAVITFFTTAIMLAAVWLAG